MPWARPACVASPRGAPRQPLLRAAYPLPLASADRIPYARASTIPGAAASWSPRWTASSSTSPSSRRQVCGGSRATPTRATTRAYPPLEPTLPHPTPPHPCTRTPLHPTRNPPTHLLFRYHTDSQPDTLPFSTRALIPPPPTLEPRLTPTHLNPSTHAARCTLCTHGDAKVMLR